MPAPIPPPPPQPSLDETRVAVRYVRVLSACLVGLFLAWSMLYGPDHGLVKYGRHNGASWNLYKLHNLDVDARRAHEGGRIVWLVGSSVLRDGFDEEIINTGLEERESPFRVVKFGQTRGAAGLTAGLLARIPLEEGDLVVHNVMVENFREEWIGFTKMPRWRITLMSRPAWIWEISEWGWQDKLEETVAVPRRFYGFRDDFMGGAFKWLNAPFKGKVPKVRTSSMHISHRDNYDDDWADRPRRMGSTHPYYQPAAITSFASEQFNIQGLERIRSMAHDAGAEVAFIDTPGRQEYQSIFHPPQTQALWVDWMREQPELAHFPQLPESHYYDMKHTNEDGREEWSTYFVDWLTSDRPRGHRAAPQWDAQEAPRGDAP